MPDGTAAAHLYKPKLVTIFQEGYSAGSFRKDCLAAITVAAVALPLSMAIAVASGVSPERGLYAAIVGGFFVSALGGSRFQIGGPAGAFILLVSTTAARFGIEALLITVLISGVILTLMGLTRLGSLIRFIPHAVTVGFTCGIAITILASQLRDLAGLKLVGTEPGPLLPKLATLLAALPSFNPAALALGSCTATLIFVLKKWRPSFPGMLLSLAIATLVAQQFQLPVDTVGSRFGEIPIGAPAPHIPYITASLVFELLPMALSFALLGGVESLLSAKVADGMTGRKHRYNMELVAQGVANIASAVFGGISVTGTIARTATNIRAGARSPLAGILHSALLLVLLVAAAPLAGNIPLSALAGLLSVVCWNMFEKKEFFDLLGNYRTASILLVTFLLTLTVDLITGIFFGCLSAGIFAAFERKQHAQGESRK